MVNAHHHVVADTLQQVLDLKIKILIIINPEAILMHRSYADELALWNSTLIRDTVKSPEYQELFPMKIRNDVSSKKKWYTEAGGGVYATSSGGAVTGFRAGRMEQE